jgi:hypothetical protein
MREIGLLPISAKNSANDVSNQAAPDDDAGGATFASRHISGDLFG